MLSSIATTVINFTDVAFVSRVSETALAASALGGVFYFLLVMIGIALGIGAQIMMSRQAGEGRPSLIGEVYNHTLLLLLGLGMLMMFFLFTLQNEVADRVLRDKAVAEQVLVYLKARAYGLPFIMLFTSLRAFYTSITLTRIITYSTVLMMLLNVGLNYLFVFGGMGVPAMGLYGAGLASAFSEAAAAIYAFLYVVLGKRFRQFALFRTTGYRQGIFAAIIKLSAPIVLQNLLSMGAWFLFFVLIEKLGSYELAVSNVVRSIYMVLMTPVWGFSQAANSMVSNLIGQGLKDRVMLLIGKIVRISLLTGTAGVLLSLLLRKWLFAISTSDPQLIEDSSGSFYVVCLATVFFSVSMIYLSAVSGTGHTLAAMLIEFVSLSLYVGYLILFTLFFPSTLEVVWFAEVLYWLALGLCCVLYLRSGHWKTNSPSMVNYE